MNKGEMRGFPLPEQFQPESTNHLEQIALDLGITPDAEFDAVQEELKEHPDQAMSLYTSWSATQRSALGEDTKSPEYQRKSTELVIRQAMLGLQMEDRMLAMSALRSAISYANNTGMGKVADELEQEYRKLIN